MGIDGHVGWLRSDLARWECAYDCDARADRDETGEVGDGCVHHAKAARGGGSADGSRIVGAVDAVEVVPR